jgi:sodium/pantothenate symporter
VGAVGLGWLAVGAYATIALALAWRGARKTGGVASYAVGNRDLPAPVVGLSLAAQLTSVATFVINPGLVHAFGLSALLGYGVFAGLGIGFGLVLLSPPFRAHGARVRALSVPQWIGARYESPALRVLFAALSLGLVSFAVLIVVALSLVLAQLLGEPPERVAVGLVVFVLAGVLIGGATGHAWTNAAQAMVMLVVACVLIGGGLPHLGSEAGLLARLRAIDPVLASPTNPVSPYFRNAFEAFFCNAIVGFAIVCQPHVLGKALYLREERQLRPYLATAIAAGVVFTGVLVVGLWARLELPPGPIAIDRVVPTWIGMSFTPAVQVLIAVGMLCAGLSTLEGILLALSSILAVDVHPLLRGGGGERDALRFGRFGLCLLGLVIVALAFWQLKHPTGGSVAIFAQYGVYLLFTVSFVPLFCGMFLPGVGRRLVTGGVLAALGGYLLTAVLRLTPLANNPAVLATFGIGAGAAVIAAGLAWKRLGRT